MASPQPSPGADIASYKRSLVGGDGDPEKEIEMEGKRPKLDQLADPKKPPAAGPSMIAIDHGLLAPGRITSSNTSKDGALEDVVVTSFEEYPIGNQGGFPLPTAPPVRFASSFSDITLPLPNLGNSISFGTNGVLAPSSLQYASMGQKHIGNSLLTTPVPEDPIFQLESGDAAGKHLVSEDASKVTTGDLSLAANALLDLTPAIVQERAPLKEQSPNAKIAQSKHGMPIEEKKSNAAPPGHAEAVSQIQLINANLAARTQRLLENVPLTLVACKCKNTKCLKLYCNCFQTGTYCDELICKCKGCNNTEEHSVPRGARARAIHEILNRRIDAFEPRLKKKTGQGCSCKKNKCLQKYCDCFANGHACSVMCSCSACSNSGVKSSRNGC